MNNDINMLERAIITPTFSGHFGYIKKYLESFDKYLLDKDFPLCFIISKSETIEFQNLIRPFENNLNIRTYYLEDILEKFNIKESPDELMILYGRLSFQTIKKLYGALYIGAEQFLFLDSESMLIKPTNINSLFEEYFKNPKFFVSKIDNRRKTYNSNFTYEFIRAITCLMNKKPEFYTTESYEWFYELRILKDSIKKLGQPIDVIRNYDMPGRFPNIEGILEALWYYQYLLYNNHYGYKIYVSDEELENFLGSEYRKFKLEFDSSPFWAFGILEIISKFINKHNVTQLCQLYNHFKFSVGRMELPNHSKDLVYQEEFLKNTNIHILASNQEHRCGINKKLISNNKYYNHLRKNVQLFIFPFKSVLKWLCSVFNILFYAIKLLVRR